MKDLVLKETMVLSRLESEIQSVSRKRRHDSQITRIKTITDLTFRALALR